MNLIRVKVKLPKSITADELRYKHGFGTNMQGCDVSNGECFLVYPLDSVGEATGTAKRMHDIFAPLGVRIMTGDLCECPDLVFFLGLSPLFDVDGNETKTVNVNGRAFRFDTNMFGDKCYFTSDDSKGVQSSACAFKLRYSEKFKHVRLLSTGYGIRDVVETLDAVAKRRAFYEAFTQGEGVGYIVG